MATPNQRRRRRAVDDAAKVQRRLDILTAAKVTFADGGFHDTKISDVARAAGLSYGSVYSYFESKDDLFHALMDHEERALRSHLEQTVGSLVLDGNVNGETLLRQAVRATFEFFERDSASVKLLFRDSLLLGDRFERHLGGIYEGFITDIEKSITAAQSTGSVIDAPPRVIAFSIAALIGQLALRRLSTDDGMPAHEVADLVVRLLLDGLRPR